VPTSCTLVLGGYSVLTANRERSESQALILSAFDGEVKNSFSAASISPAESAKDEKPVRKKLIRRDGRDYSQRLRSIVQILFAALNAWIGVQFYLWVRWAERGGRGFEVSRPAGVEGWLPIEGLMQLKYFLVTGKVPNVHAAGFFLFTLFLIISFVFRKAFAAGCVRWVPYPNISRSLAACLLVVTSSCRAGPISRCTR
jgi:hypothetical protein